MAEVTDQKDRKVFYKHSYTRVWICLQALVSVGEEALSWERHSGKRCCCASISICTCKLTLMHWYLFWPTGAAHGEADQQVEKLTCLHVTCMPHPCGRVDI
eukprot:1150342-Pelagomonas_calceolata.AAC.20